MINRLRIMLIEILCLIVGIIILILFYQLSVTKEKNRLPDVMVYDQSFIVGLDMDEQHKQKVMDMILTEIEKHERL